MCICTYVRVCVCVWISHSTSLFCNNNYELNKDLPKGNNYLKAREAYSVCGIIRQFIFFNFYAFYYTNG